jgi:hypothetical protein
MLFLLNAFIGTFDMFVLGAAIYFDANYYIIFVKRQNNLVSTTASAHINPDDVPYSSCSHYEVLHV